MPKRSAGILLYKRAGPIIRLLLAHPGGPFWAKKGVGAWSIPKGEYDDGEDPLAAALREFEEELGVRPSGDFVSLGTIPQPSRKLVTVWAVEGDFEVGGLRSNTFTLEWPPRSGHQQVFPEVDRVAWFTPEEAKRMILRGQREFIDRLLAAIGPGQIE